MLTVDFGRPLSAYQNESVLICNCLNDKSGQLDLGYVFLDSINGDKLRDIDLCYIHNAFLWRHAKLREPKRVYVDTGLRRRSIDATLLFSLKNIDETIFNEFSNLSVSNYHSLEKFGY